MFEKGKYLVTSDVWFTAPDGQQYNAAWGDVEVIKAHDFLGFNPSHSTNWLLKVGTGENALIMAGCRIHFFVKCEERPIKKDGGYRNKDTNEYMVHNRIYFPDDTIVTYEEEKPT